MKSPPRMRTRFYQPYLETTLCVWSIWLIPQAPLRHSNSRTSRGDHPKSSGNSSHRYSSLPHKKHDNLRVCVINCNSARNRRVQFEYLAEHVKPDIMLITETKLADDNKSSKFLPDAYLGTIRKDRNDKGGGVMITVHCDLDVVDIELCENTAETVWDSFYRTNSTHTALDSSRGPYASVPKNWENWPTSA